MSDTLRSGGDIEQQKQQPSPQSPDIIEKQKRLEKLGISVDSDILERIEADVGAKRAFEQDLVVIENNPTEKARFEQMYIKGYGQAVETPFGKLSFAQIQKHPERSKILDGMKRGEKANFRDWEEQVAINEGKKIDEGTQIAIAKKNSELEGEKVDIHENKKLEKMHSELDSEIKQIQSIKGIPVPTPEELQKTVENIPELQGANPEDIKQGKYNNILLADYYIRNEKTIAKNIDPNDVQKFKESIKSLSKTLERPYTEKFGPLTKQLVLGENRDKIESMGKELIKSGYSPDVMWNPQDRTMTFSNQKGEKRIIDTAKVPPTERLKNGAIEVSKELDKPKTNIYSSERQSSENLMNSLIKNAKDGPVIGAILGYTLLEEGWKKVQEEKNPLERTVLSLETLGNKRRVIKELAKKAEENGELKEAETLKEALPQIDKQIQDIIAEGQKLAEISKKEKEEESKTNTDTFGDIARQNIEGLQKLGLSGFMDMSEVADFLSTQNSPTFGGEFSDRESINSHLGKQKLNNEQYIQLLSGIVNIYQNITGTKELQSMEKSEQVRFLMRPTENGKTRLENALNSERIRQDGRPLNQADFKRILGNTEGQKSEAK